MDSTHSAGSVVDAAAVLSDSLTALTALVQDPTALDLLGDDALLDVFRGFESVRRRLTVINSALTAAAERRSLPERHCQGTTRRFLASLLRLSPAEAARRARAAEALGPRTTMSGEPLPPVRPVLAAAQHGGEVSPEHTDVILTALASIDHRGFDPRDVARAETTLTRHARTFDPPALRRLAEKVVEAIDPDGTVPPEESQASRRQVRLSQGRDQLWRGALTLTPACGAKLSTVLRALASDRSRVERGGDSVQQDPDTRSHPQRLHDALEAACDLLLRADTLPASGGTPATVIVTLTEEQLRTRTGVARVADGSRLPVRDLGDLAGGAEVWGVVVGEDGVPLRLARTRRIASPGQTIALIARDGGCCFPGCEVAPEWCERHHIREWSLGGRTDMDNLVLLCRYHHRHHLSRGWAVLISAAGVPEWRPPSWIDPQRRPRVNHRILARLLQAGQGTLSDDPVRWDDETHPPGPPDAADEPAGREGADDAVRSDGCLGADGRRWNAADGRLVSDELDAPEGANAPDGWDAPDRWDGAAYWDDAEADPDQLLEEPSDWAGWTTADTAALHQVWLAWDAEQAGAGGR